MPLAFLANNFLGVPQADQTEAKRGPIFLNRGTENDLIAFDSQGVQAWDVVAPGQSGYVTLAGENPATTRTSSACTINSAGSGYG